MNNHMLMKKNSSSKLMPSINKSHTNSINNNNSNFPTTNVGKIVPMTNPLVRSASQPINKGKLVKGINYDTESLSIFSKAKLR